MSATNNNTLPPVRIVHVQPHQRPPSGRQILTALPGESCLLNEMITITDAAISYHAGAGDLAREYADYDRAAHHDRLRGNALDSFEQLSDTWDELYAVRHN